MAERKSDHCLNCNERIEYVTDCADGRSRWMHVGMTGDDDPYGHRESLYQNCRFALAVPQQENRK